MKKPHWTDALCDRLHRFKEDVVPKGWESARQMAKHAGISIRGAHGRLEKLYKAGLVERKSFNAISTHGRIRSTYFYRKK